MGEEALVMCPESSSAYHLLAITHMMDYWLGSTKSPQESIERAIELAQKAIALDAFLNMDDDSLFRHADLVRPRGVSEERV
jgi:hypothetical protein